MEKQGEIILYQPDEAVRLEAVSYTHLDVYKRQVFMARSHYTVLTFKNRIYNYTEFNSAVHQHKLAPVWACMAALLH